MASAAVALIWPAQAAGSPRNRSRAGGPRAALAYGVLTMVGKWFQMAGQLLYLCDRIAGRRARLIEYKFAVSGTRRTATST